MRSGGGGELFERVRGAQAQTAPETGDGGVKFSSFLLHLQKTPLRQHISRSGAKERQEDGRREVDVEKHTGA